MTILLSPPARVHSTRTRRPRPTAADRAWFAAQNTDHHTAEPTPVEVLDAPAPFDADELAEAGRRSDALPMLDPARGPAPSGPLSFAPASQPRRPRA
jgi:hypothetical protein